MIRSTKHSLIFTNINKRDELILFLDECKRVANLYLNYLWENEIVWAINDKNYSMNIVQDNLNHPKWLSTVDIEKNISNFKTTLSARATKCIITQVLGMIGASTEKQRKRLYVAKKMLDNQGFITEQLMKKIKDNKPVKPNLNNIFFEFNSICCDFKETLNGEFTGFLQLKSLGKEFAKIKIPIKFTRANNKFKNWKRLTSFLISKSYVDIRWEKPNKLKEYGNIVGADQGFKDVLTLSDKQVTPKFDNHNHSLESILKKLTRKIKGSRSFKKAQEHRENFIHWSLNQLNLNNIKQINLEKIWNIGYKNKKSRLMSHWTNAIIRDKIKRMSEEQEVLVIDQDSIYRSQRCSECGLVRKANRKGKIYTCTNCGSIIDSDLNAALNHEIILPKISWTFRNLKLNKLGFFWKESGLFNLEGVQLAVELNPSNEHYNYET